MRGFVVDYLDFHSGYMYCQRRIVFIGHRRD
ncbi:hypothetical protein [Pseudomonas shahriarae]